MSDNKITIDMGIAPLSTLTLIFIVLKLTNIITWSWFWVLSPTLIPIGLLIFIISIVLLVGLFYNLKDRTED